ncbi:MAG: hypothetical protein QOH10_2876, partial [Actinomycetota bacterium]|nr:hypothetical protein [Actinomycetota bacterium]
LVRQIVADAEAVLDRIASMARSDA